MVEHQAPTHVHEQFTPTHDALVRRSCTPPLGQQLRVAVDKALCELSVTPDPDRVILRGLDDQLVAGLAWAAATGDTCRIQPAVQAVRAARARLAADDAEGARAALRTARDCLGRPPTERRDPPASRTDTDSLAPAAARSEAVRVAGNAGSLRP